MAITNFTIDKTEEESIPLGYSVSVLGNDTSDHGKNVIEKSVINLSGENSRLKSFSSNTTTSSNITSKSPIVLDKWYIQPVKGIQAVKVCGTKVSDGKLHKSSGIRMRVNSRCILSFNGSLYKIIGPIQHALNMPVWFEEKFFNGFPELWKSYVDDYLEWLCQRSSGDDSDDDNHMKRSIETPRIGDDQIKLLLYRWVLYFCGKHLSVEGFTVTVDDRPKLYRTSTVIDVIGKDVIYTTTRSYYRLCGPLNVEATVQSGVPLWFAKKFISGFPANWRDMIDVYLSYHNNLDPSKQDSCSTEVMTLLSCEGFLPGNAGVSNPKEFLNTSQNRTTNDVGMPSKLNNDITKMISEKNDQKFSYKSPSEKKESSDEDLTEAKKNFNTENQMIDTPVAKTRKINKKLFKTPSNYSLVEQHIYDVKMKNSRKKVKNLFKTPSSDNHLNKMATNGLYRTRSGRHVFPPLERWTYQRLNTEYDANGNEVVVFYPGKESLLSDKSPACDFLRKAKWIRKQFHQDQLMFTPNVGQKQKIKVTQIVQKHPSCVKNLLDDCSNNNDIISSSGIDTLSQSFIDETEEARKSYVLKNKSVSPISKYVSQINSKENAFVKPLISINRLSNAFPLSIRENEKNCSNTSKHLEEKKLSKFLTRSQSFRNKENCSIPVPVKLNSSETINMDDRHLTTKSSYNLRRRKVVDYAKMGENCKVSRSRKSKINQTGRFDDQTHVPILVFSPKKQNTRIASNNKLVSSENLSLAHIDKSKLNECELSKKKLSWICETNRDVISSYNLRKSPKARLHFKQSSLNKQKKKRTTSKKIKQETVKKNKKNVKTTTTAASGSNKIDYSPKNSTNHGNFGKIENDFVTLRDRNKKSVAKISRRGTIKRRRQVKKISEQLMSQVEQDFFSDNVDELYNNFSTDCFTSNYNKPYNLPCTPADRIGSEFDQHISTPAWFKTPTGTDIFEFKLAETPADMPNFSSQTNANVDRCIVQMQKPDNKRPKLLKATRNKNTKSKPLIIPKDLFVVEADDTKNSSDDDNYFSS